MRNVNIPNANFPAEIVQVNDGEALLCQIKSFLRRVFRYLLVIRNTFLNHIRILLCCVWLLWKWSLHKRYATYKYKWCRFARHYLHIKWKNLKTIFRTTEITKTVLLLDWATVYPKMVSSVLQMLIQR